MQGKDFLIMKILTNNYIKTIKHIEVLKNRSSMEVHDAGFDG